MKGNIFLDHVKEPTRLLYHDLGSIRDDLHCEEYNSDNSFQTNSDFRYFFMSMGQCSSERELITRRPCGLCSFSGWELSLYIRILWWVFLGWRERNCVNYCRDCWCFYNIPHPDEIPFSESMSVVLVYYAYLWLEHACLSQARSCTRYFATPAVFAN